MQQVLHLHAYQKFYSVASTSFGSATALQAHSDSGIWPIYIKTT